jgi:hypothetical protein
LWLLYSILLTFSNQDITSWIKCKYRACIQTLCRLQRYRGRGKCLYFIIYFKKDYNLFLYIRYCFAYNSNNTKCRISLMAMIFYSYDTFDNAALFSVLFIIELIYLNNKWLWKQFNRRVNFGCRKVNIGCRFTYLHISYIVHMFCFF